jgi:hypothetical protein
MVGYTEEVRGILSLPLYDAEACRAIIAYASGAGAWRQAEVAQPADGGGYRAVVREERAASVCAPAAESEVMRVFDAKMDGFVKPLVKHVWGVGLVAHSATHLVRYAPGDYYREHTDVALEDPYRYFSVVCYLNDDFEGGHTAFPDLSHAVAPRCGQAVIFPSTYLHRAEPVTRGEKYVIVSWLTGRQPIRWI